MKSLTRRQVLGGMSLLALTPSPSFNDLAVREASRYETPYKYGKLVLKASGEPGTFDSKSVDCPFVFHQHEKFYMTYVAFDGVGYQTGLAQSNDLTNWKKCGCILKRDPSSPIIRYNGALNWIVRKNSVRSMGELKKVRGRFLGAYHAYPNRGYEQGRAVIGLCWSDDLMHWDLDAPCLRSEDGAYWERGGLYKPCLLEHEGLYYLLYNAKTPDLPKTQGGGWREQTRVAMSKDLKHWTR